jgi:hypothetical protein
MFPFLQEVYQCLNIADNNAKVATGDAFFQLNRNNKYINIPIKKT